MTTHSKKNANFYYRTIAELHFQTLLKVYIYVYLFTIVNIMKDC